MKKQNGILIIPMVIMYNVKRDANTREFKQAEQLGMTRCAASGAGMHKGDIRNDLALIDSKFTYGKNQITIKRSDIEKLDVEAFDYIPSRIPAMLISINGFERMIISVSDFQNYLRLLKEETNG
jgi:hypothetical protein